eukprot:TRINITY_DN10057_c0_g2_i1.p1 TRINITY_DN10057_c0_g2~~TRINITY_DN10057_c0_g2_i1.p1  ORF type:complete len:196 (+),score=26.75 TRINITY_DN10057_c0_g2_i1:719-1306(+)
MLRRLSEHDFFLDFKRIRIKVIEPTQGIDDHFKRNEIFEINVDEMHPIYQDKVRATLKVYKAFTEFEKLHREVSKLTHQIPELPQPKRNNFLLLHGGQAKAFLVEISSYFSTLVNLIIHNRLTPQASNQISAQLKSLLEFENLKFCTPTVEGETYIYDLRDTDSVALAKENEPTQAPLNIANPKRIIKGIMNIAK